MRGGLLTGPRTLELGEGWSLRLLSAWEAMEAAQQGEALAADGREEALCANACLLAMALRKNGSAAFADGRAVLEALTAGQIAGLAERWAAFDRQVNASVLDGEEAVEEAKKAWSTRLMRAFSGVCSGCSARFLRRSGPER